jgi:hypothetical protein
MSRRLVIIVIAVLGVVPIATGLLAVIGGPVAEPGGEVISPSLDSEYRFAHVIWIGAGVVLWWSLRRAAQRALVTRVVLLIAAAGGIGRIISAVLYGLPHPVFIAAGCVELFVVPLVVLWHSRVFPLARTAEPAAR